MQRERESWRSWGKDEYMYACKAVYRKPCEVREGERKWVGGEEEWDELCMYKTEGRYACS